ncbi:hypothetical protein [Clostridium estertheticum]|nr:hypothetical protein [Clostridium estertheticum]
MKNSKKYVEIRKLHNEGYLCYVGLEIQDNIERMDKLFQNS